MRQKERIQLDSLESWSLQVSKVGVFVKSHDERMTVWNQTTMQSELCQ